MYKDRFDSKIGCKGTDFFLYTQYFAKKLPFRYRIVVDIFGDFGYHGGAEFVLHIIEQAAGVEGLIGCIGFVERFFGVNVVGKMYRHADGQFAF